MQNSKLIRIGLPFLIQIFCLLSFLWLSKALFLGYYPDFSTQYYVPKMILAGLNPYEGGGDLFTGQVYPPTVFFLFLPISLLPIGFASYLYTFLSIAALVVSLYLLSKIFNFRFFGNTNLILMSLVFISFPVKFTLGMGQINNFILLLLVLLLWYLQKKQDFVAGIFLGLSIIIKLFPLFLPVYLLLKFKKGNRMHFFPWIRLKIWYQKRQLRDDLEMLDGLFVVAAIAGLLIVFLIPKEIYLQFFFETLPSLVNSWKTDYYNQALSGFVGRSFGTGDVAFIIKTGASLAITALTLFIITKNEDTGFGAIALKLGTLITLSLIVNTFSWQHHFVWLIIPFYAIVSYLRLASSSRAFYVVLLIPFLLVSTNLRDPSLVPIFIKSHVLYGTFILLCLNLYLLSKKDLAKRLD